MTTFLRRSGHLARLSVRNVECASRPHIRIRTSLPAARYGHAYQHSRRYAAVPPPENHDKKNKNGRIPQPPNDEKKVAGKGNEAQAHPQPEPENGAEPQPPPKEQPQEDGKVQVSKLSPEDEAALEELKEKFIQGLPSKQAAAIIRTLDAFKEDGQIPPEVRGIIEEMRKGGFSLSLVAKFIRLANQVASKAADMEFEEAANEKQEPKQKSGAHDPGPQSTKDEDGDSGKAGQKKKKPEEEFFKTEFKFDFNTFILSVITTWLLYRLVTPGENSREITWQEFRSTFLDKGLVEKVIVLNRNRAKVYLHRDAVRTLYPESPAVHDNFYYYFSIGSVEAFEAKMENAQKELDIPSSDRIPVAYTDTVPWKETILSFAPTLLFIGALAWLGRRAASGGGGQSGIFGMGKSRAKRFNHETEIKIKFADVAGMDEAKQEIMEFVSFLKEPGIYQKLGAKIPRGAILSGPPGTGKTLLAKATAGESGVPFFSVSGSEFVEMFVGVGPSRVRDLFATARKNTPCIIFIDEIDAIGKSRAKQNFGGGNDERESTLNQILTEMDGFNTTEQVVVIAGTNRPDILDKALLRPGRFDRHIAIDRPTMDGRKQIFAVHLKKIVTNEDIDYLKGRLSALTPGFSGADIANCVNEAALIAARYHATSVTMQHFEQAIERVIGGLEKKSLVLSPDEKKVVAYHEAGHAICGWYFKWADPLLKVSIIPRGQGALGYAQYLPAGDTYLMNVNQLMDRMAMTLGGRVSEELHFETVTSGASDDFSKVTSMARAMVTRFGMSRKIGYLSFDDDAQQQLHKPFSEETAKNIDSEVKRIVEEAYTQCRDLLSVKMEEMRVVAEELLSKEVLTRDDMVRLLGPRPFEDKEDFAKYFGQTGAKERGVPEPPKATDVPPPPSGTPAPEV